MNIATPRVLSGQDVRALSARSDLIGGLQTALHLGLLIAAGWLVLHAGSWLIVPAIMLLGIIQVALFAPLHETMHLTAFASRRANAVVGWLTSCPSLMNWHFYTAFHLAHHRHTQDPLRDPELTPLPPSGLDSYATRVLAINFWRARARVIVDCWRGDLAGYPYIAEKSRARIIASVRWMCVLMIALSLASMLLIGWWAPLVLWILPQLLAQPLLRLYLLTEHTLCSEDANGLTNTRTTLTNAVLRVLMWNMSYHAEHHLYPSIPFHRLADAHRAVRDRLGVVQPGYARWHMAFLGRLLRQS
jgi:fatty acid desaturase